MIAVTDLCVRFDDRAVLDHVSCTIDRGESVALVGPNGSGKTTLLRCLLGLVPFTGAARVGGHDVVRQPVAARVLMAYVPQKPAFGDALAIEVLRFVARLRRVANDKPLEMLERVGLAAHARERVRTFSGGMQQRLSLALVLLVCPAVVLFDEPSASLDQAGQQTFYEMVAALRREGCTLLLASHRPEEVESLTDRVLHVDAGHVRAAADPPVARARVIAIAGRGGR